MSARHQHATAGSVQTGDSYPLPVKQALPAAPTEVSGDLTAPAAAAMVADTGPLAAGVYLVEVAIAFADTLAAGKVAHAEHRDGANGANVARLGSCSAGDSTFVVARRLTLAANERVRVVNGGVAGAAGSVLSAAIRAYKLD